MRQNRPRCNVCLTQAAADDGTGRCLTCQARDDDPYVSAGADLSDWLADRLKA